MTNPVNNPRITQPWGRPNPRYAAKRHTGIDYGMPVGTPLFAVTDGTIKDVLNDKSYGKVVVLSATHEGTKYDIWYCHMSKPEVKKGQKVSVGTQLGLSGNTGNSTGPHLHLETRIAPFRYGNDVSNPWIQDPKTIDPKAPSNRKVGIVKKAVAVVTPAKQPAAKTVYMHSFVDGAMNDDIKLVQSALIDIVGAKIPTSGKLDKKTRDAYKLWQHKLGYNGKDADGLPGKKSLTALGNKYGFKVK